MSHLSSQHEQDNSGGVHARSQCPHRAHAMSTLVEVPRQPSARGHRCSIWWVAHALSQAHSRKECLGRITARKPARSCRGARGSPGSV
eukprot:UN3023